LNFCAKTEFEFTEEYHARLSSKLIPLFIYAALATSFLVYRIGLVLVGYYRPCSCMGSLTEELHISPEIADMAMKIILAYLLIGSYGSLIWLWRKKRMALRAAVDEQ